MACTRNASSFANVERPIQVFISQRNQRQPVDHCCRSDVKLTSTTETSLVSEQTAFNVLWARNRPVSAWLSTSNSTFYPFTSERFHVLWTLSSKFFSTVPHGTCSLSDSRSYLALGGAYHLLRAAIPNNPTLRTTITASLRIEATTNRPFTCYGQTTIKRSRVARLIGYNRQFQTPQFPVIV